MAKPSPIGVKFEDIKLKEGYSFLEENVFILGGSDF